jgi:hypothetical protein
MSSRLMKFLKNPRGVEKIAVEYYAYPIVMDAPDWYVSQEMREYADPYFTPLTVRTVYRTIDDGAIHKFDRHVIAVGDPHPIKDTHPDFKNNPVHRAATEFETVYPREILDILEAEIKGWDRFPGPFIPLSMKHVHLYRALGKMADDFMADMGIERDMFTEALATTAGQSFLRMKQRLYAKFKDEHDYRWDAEWAGFKRDIDNLTPEEYAIIKRNKRARALLQHIGHVL